MRIGIDARLHYYQKAGIAYYTLRLLGAMAALDRDTEFVVLQSRKDSVPLIPSPTVRSRFLWTPCHHRLEQVGLAAEIALIGLDLLHCPDFVPPYLRRCRSVITVHDLAFLVHPETLTRESLRYYSQTRWAVRSADRIIAVSHSTRNDLISLLGVPPEKIDVVHSAADESFHPLSPDAIGRYRQENRLPARFVLFVGTIEPRKNLPTLIQAFALVKKQTGEADLQLVLAGAKGWLYQDALALVGTLGLEDSVRLLRPDSSEELALLYNAATVFVLPSLYEGFGFPALEAMACGTPVVASRTSALTEIVADAGELVEPTDSKALAQVLMTLLGDETLRAELRAMGLRRSAEFSWQKTAAETLASYRKAVA
ncbi:MAG: glycosyltransferase family 1 protein [Chloroflexota bacterium]|nr:MAG: glycosyltransferase family 1 protein [Chloroflexota bacterium]